MIFRQLFDPDSCTYSYLLGDEESREAILIDSVFEFHERDAALISELGLTLRFTLDTHCHADHITGAWLMKKRFNSSIAISKVYGASNVDRALSDGDTIEFGKSRLDVVATPGHTEGCLSFVTADKAMVFTGDCLLVRGTGRTDFQAGDAHLLFRSIQDKIFSLPNECLIYPGHDYNGRTASSVKEEREFNPRIGGDATERDFVEYMDNLGLPHPRKIAMALPANLRCGMPENTIESEQWGPVATTFSGHTEISPDWVAEHLSELTVLDVRNPEELSATGIISGALCIPLAELAGRLAEVPADIPVVAICHSGKRSALATDILRKSNFARVANITGGMVRWQLQGLPLVR